MNQRLEWLDVMKGFTMFLVVLGHILNSMGLFHHPVNLWIHQFHMPFFFMLSGFLAIKTLKRNLYINIKTKLITLMLPFIVCGGTYALTFDRINEFIYTEAHAGYWFLLSLFTCWLIFLPLGATLQRFKLGRNFIIEAFVLIAPFFLGNLLMRYIPNNLLTSFSFSFTFADYRFFILGYFIGKWYENGYLTKRLTGISPWIFPIATIVFYSITLCFLVQANAIYQIPVTVWQILLCLSLFVILHNSANFTNYIIFKYLSWIGKNSLALYVFHTYFVYLFPLKEIKDITSGFQILIAIALTIVVIIATMMASSPFRNSKVLTFLFLGQKK